MAMQAMPEVNDTTINNRQDVAQPFMDILLVPDDGDAESMRIAVAIRLRDDEARYMQGHGGIVQRQKMEPKEDVGNCCKYYLISAAAHALFGIARKTIAMEPKSDPAGGGQSFDCCFWSE